MHQTANPEMVTIARLSRGMTQTELAESIGRSQATVSKVEQGQQRVTDDLLDALVQALRYPPAFFYEQGTRFLPGVSYHRKRQSLSKGDRERIEGVSNVQRLHVRRLLQAAEIPSDIPRLKLDDFEGDARQVARALRQAWQVPPGPIPNLTRLVEDAGIIVVHRDFGTDRLDGLSYPYADLPIIFLNSRLPADRVRFSLAHELGHMLMHKVPYPEAEEEADQFAAELLMPADEIVDHLQPFSIERLASLKPYWQVSMAALLKQACDHGVLVGNQQRYQWAKFARLGYRTHEPRALDLPPERPALLHELIELHRQDLGYSREEMADALSLILDEYVELYEPAEPPHLRLVSSH